MNDTNYLMLFLAFIVGYMMVGVMKNMCGGRLVEGFDSAEKELKNTILGKYEIFRSQARENINRRANNQLDQINDIYPCDGQKLEELITKCKKDAQNKSNKGDKKEYCTNCFLNRWEIKDQSPKYDLNNTNKCDIFGLKNIFENGASRTTRIGTKKIDPQSSSDIDAMAVDAAIDSVGGVTPGGVNMPLNSNGSDIRSAVSEFCDNI